MVECCELHVTLATNKLHLAVGKKVIADDSYGDYFNDNDKEDSEEGEKENKDTKDGADNGSNEDGHDKAGSDENSDDDEFDDWPRVPKGNDKDNDTTKPHIPAIIARLDKYPKSGLVLDMELNERELKYLVDNRSSFIPNIRSLSLLHLSRKLIIEG